MANPIAVAYFQTIHFFFFNDTATTEIYTLSLHDALPISFEGRTKATPDDVRRVAVMSLRHRLRRDPLETVDSGARISAKRSEEHTSELQSPDHLVCRLLLEKKKKSHTVMTERVGLTSGRS